MSLPCFKSKDRGPSTGIGESSEVENAKTPLITHIAIVKGHWSSPDSRKGTTTYRTDKKVWEWDYVSQVANQILINAHKVSPTGKIKVNTFDRPDTSYDASMKQLADNIENWCGKENCETTLVIELHLNGAGIPEARGCEMLIQDGDDKSAKVAKIIIHDWSAKFNIKLRRQYKGIRGIKPTVYTWREKTAGGGFNHYMRKKGFYNCLFEPFFADFENEETKRFCQDDNGPRFMGDFFVGCLSTLNTRLATELETEA